LLPQLLFVVESLYRITELCRSHGETMVAITRRPVMDGPEASRLIRVKNKSVPIVALTANASTDARDMCYESGMTGFLTKPVNLRDLTDTIKTALAWRETH
jgi:CheY-like chemotaxis protein